MHPSFDYKINCPQIWCKYLRATIRTCPTYSSFFLRMKHLFTKKDCTPFLKIITKILPQAAFRTGRETSIQGLLKNLPQHPFSFKNKKDRKKEIPLSTAMTEGHHQSLHMTALNKKPTNAIRFPNSNAGGSGHSSSHSMK